MFFGNAHPLWRKNSVQYGALELPYKNPPDALVEPK
jgi:hypothetical protein